MQITLLFVAILWHITWYNQPVLLFVLCGTVMTYTFQISGISFITDLHHMIYNSWNKTQKAFHVTCFYIQGFFDVFLFCSFKQVAS